MKLTMWNKLHKKLSNLYQLESYIIDQLFLKYYYNDKKRTQLLPQLKVVFKEEKKIIDLMEPDKMESSRQFYAGSTSEIGNYFEEYYGFETHSHCPSYSYLTWVDSLLRTKK
jgi:hypothetical protein